MRDCFSVWLDHSSCTAHGVTMVKMAALSSLSLTALSGFNKDQVVIVWMKISWEFLQPPNFAVRLYPQA